MRTSFPKSSLKAASVLVITLFLGLILTTMVGGYLCWVRAQNALVAQSQAWNGALAIAEAGIEEAMAQINVAAGNLSTNNAATNYVASVQANWGSPSGGIYGPKLNTLSNGSYGVIISPDNPGPTIIATGYAIVPLIGKQIARTVKVTTTTSALFGNAIAALQNVDLSGNGVMVDSYVSSDTNKFPGGLYNTTNRMAGGDVASVGGIITVQNANIYGHLRIGPTGDATVGSNGRVGDLNWQTMGQIQPGWIQNDFNMDFPDVLEPFSPGSGGLVSSTTVQGKVTYTISNGGNYTMSALTLGSGDTLVVTNNANATLYVTGDVTMNSGGGKSSLITIAAGSTLKLYVAGATTKLITVNAPNAASFQYFGLPTNTSLSWNGNATYWGLVYAPGADVTLGGGGSTIYDFQGSLSIKSLKMNGHFNIHFDEAAKASYLGGFVASSWREL